MRAPDAKKLVLLVIHTNTYFTNLLPVAQLLQRSSSYTPAFWFVSPYPTLSRDQETCRCAGIPYRGYDAPRTLSSVPHHLDYALGRAAPPLHQTVQLLRTMYTVRRLLRELTAALVILPADNRYDQAVYVRAAHEEKVPVAILPAFMAAAREWAEAMSHNPDYSLDKLPNRVAGWLYPKWVHEHEGKRMIALPSSQLLARQWLGLTPPRPWTLHSGRADAIAMESAAMKRYCLSEGLPAERLILTGSVDHDMMYQRLTDLRVRAELVQRLRLEPDRRILLTALPPDQLYGAGRKMCDFQDYEELVRFWISSLCIEGWHTIVTLHPSVKRDDWVHLERFGVTIADESTASLIPLCDLYVASISATIQWAIACGKPIINYDIYRFRYPDYLGVEGIVATEEKDVFLSAVQRVTSDSHYHRELAVLQQRRASEWGALDGHAGTRLLNLFDRLTTTP